MQNETTLPCYDKPPIITRGLDEICLHGKPLDDRKPLHRVRLDNPITIHKHGIKFTIGYLGRCDKCGQLYIWRKSE